jgi:metal-responsive CopG/Arc/MetJ family transcriptional regulator
MNDEEKVKLSLLMKMLNEQTPVNIPSREEVIQKAARAFLQANRSKRR